jgi:4-carboxymuconolactone decarboxylase
MARHTVRKNLERLFQDDKPLGESDPDFVEIFNRFAYAKVAQRGSLNDQQRSIAVLSALLGCQSVDEFAVMAEVALKVGVAPKVLKEMLYQAVALLGMGPVFPFLRVSNDLLESKNVRLPLSQETVPDDASVQHHLQEFDNLVQIGADVEAEDDSRLGTLRNWQNEYSYGNCYPRSPMDVRMRELSSYCLLVAIGDVDEELARSVGTNAAVGNDRVFLSDALLQCTPYIGFPRVRHALKLLERSDDETLQ